MTCGLVVLVLHFGLADAYLVRGASVSGNRRLPAETVYAASGIDGRNVFFVNPAVVADRLESLPEIKRAHIEMALPLQVQILIEETSPVLMWQSSVGRWAIDEEGRAVTPPPEPLPILVRDSARRVTAGGQRLPAPILAAARGYGQVFGQLEYRNELGFVVQSPEGWEVRLGTDVALLPQQVATLQALSRELGRQSGEVAFIDLRFASRPYYRLRSERGTYRSSYSTAPGDGQ